jgi:hypothetical protein
MDDCKYELVHEEPLWKDRRIVDRVSYHICVVEDELPVDRCPYPSRYCGVKQQEQEWSDLIEKFVSEVLESEK